MTDFPEPMGFYQGIFDKAREVIIVLDAEARIICANSAAVKSYGYSAAELTALSILDLSDTESKAVAKEVLKSTLFDGNLFETTHRRKNGGTFPVEVSSHDLAADNNTWTICYIRDISERVKLEEIWHQQEEIFELFMEYSPIYVFFKDENIRAIKLSKNFEKMIGRPMDEIIGKSMDELFPSYLAHKMIEDDKQTLREGLPIEVIEELAGRTYATTKFPIIRQGKPALLAGFTMDITALKQTESALRERTKELEELARTRETERVRLQREMNIAGVIQRSMIPHSGKYPKADINVIYRPLQEPGGDFLHYRWVNDSVLRGYVADVKGHGLSAALHTTAVNLIMCDQYNNRCSIDILHFLNEKILRYFDEEAFVAVLIFEFDFFTGELTIGTGGIPSFLSSRAPGGLIPIEGSFAGLEAEPEFHTVTQSFASGDIFVFTTDGILEMLQRRQALPMTNFDRTVKSIQQIASDPARWDDCTALCIRVNRGK